MALVLTPGAATALSVLLDDGMGGAGSAVPPWTLQGAPRAEGADRDAGGDDMNDGNGGAWESRGVKYASAAIRHLERRVKRLEAAVLAKSTDRPEEAEVRQEVRNVRG